MSCLSFLSVMTLPTFPAASVQGCSFLLGCLERPLCKLPAHAYISCFSSIAQCQEQAANCKT